MSIALPVWNGLPCLNSSSSSARSSPVTSVRSHISFAVTSPRDMPRFAYARTVSRSATMNLSLKLSRVGKKSTVSTRTTCSRRPLTDTFSSSPIACPNRLMNDVLATTGTGRGSDPGDTPLVTRARPADHANMSEPSPRAETSDARTLSWLAKPDTWSTFHPSMFLKSSRTAISPLDWRTRTVSITIEPGLSPCSMSVAPMPTDTSVNGRVGNSLNLGLPTSNSSAL